MRPVGLVLLIATAAMGCAASPPPPTAAQREAAVANACAGLPESERLRPVLESSGDVISYRPITELVGKQRRIVPRGVELLVPARPNVNAPYLERLARCDAARYAAMGGASTTEAPLAVEGLSITVSNLGAGYQVRLTSREPSAAREVLRRIERLEDDRLVAR